jgi:hypothetical protein
MYLGTNAMKPAKFPCSSLINRLPKIGKSWISTLVLLGLWAATPAAKAGSLTWEYHYDSDTDGYDKKTVGATSRFEHLGTAYAQDGNKSYIVIYTNVDANGVVYGKKQVRVFTGDLVLDFTGEGNLSDANGLPNLYTIKINNNESSLQLGQIGVGSTLKTVYQTNYGFPTYQQYYNKIQQARTFDGRFADPSKSEDPVLNSSYFRPKDATLSVTDRVQSTIDNAVRIISDPTEIQKLGVSMNLPGTNPSGLAKVTVVEIDNSKLPAEDFIASLLTECGNDTFAFKAAIVPVASTPPTTDTPPADTPPTTTTTTTTTTTPTTPYSISFVGTPEVGGLSTGVVVGGSALAAGLLMLLLLGGDDTTTGIASNPIPNIPGGGGNGGGGSGGGGGGGGDNGGEETKEVREYTSPISLTVLGLAACGWRYRSRRRVML